jgi:hypothetical protein
MTSMTVHDADRVQCIFDGMTSMAEFINIAKRLLNQKNYPNPATAHTGAWHFPVSGD